ncbi:chaperone SurA [Betaproteobacteria bacterium]|nr:chaperone SurA [Betaproteobacteria bacterium]
MNRPFSRILVVAALGFAAVISALVPSTAAAATVNEIDRIVAVVNSEVITSLQLRERLAQVHRQFQRQSAQLPPDDVLERQILDQMIVERAQMQLANDTSLQIDDTMIERAIGRIAAANRLTIDEMKAALVRDGIDWERFTREVRTELLLSRLREREVDNRVTVTDAEIASFIKNNPDAFSSVEYHLAHILLSPRGGDANAMAALRERVEQVLGRLGAGEDFSRVAIDSSDAPDALRGGDVGWFGRDRMPGLYAEVVTSLAPGEISSPLRSADGLHIIKLIDKRQGEDGGSTHRIEQTHARHILIKTTEILADAEAEARLRALRERIVNGSDFAELAKASSADLSASKGGDLGWLNPGDTVPEFERAMDALKPGEVSPPVHSPFGWHLIQVLERRTQDVSDEFKKNSARAILRQRKADDAYDEWLRQLRDSTYVEYRLDTE